MNSVLNVKAVVAAFNQEKALVGAFSVITNLRMQLFESLLRTVVLLQSTLAQTLQQTKAQLEACREAKHRLEMDWSDKYTAQGLGTVQCALHNINIVPTIHKNLPGACDKHLHNLL